MKNYNNSKYSNKLFNTFKKYYLSNDEPNAGDFFDNYPFLHPSKRFPDETMGDDEYLIGKSLSNNSESAFCIENYIHFVENAKFFASINNWSRVKSEIKIYLDYVQEWEAPLIGVDPKTIPHALEDYIKQNIQKKLKENQKKDFDKYDDDVPF